jgi:hypothetical protein
MSNYVGLEPTYLSHHTQSFTSDGVTSTFSLNINPGSSSAIIVNQDGVVQRPGLDYNVQLGNLVFLSTPAAPESGVTNNIFVTYLGVMVSVPSPVANSVGTTQVQDNSITPEKLTYLARGGATGGGLDKVFYENDKVITTNYTVPSNKNAITAGPVTINPGVTVDVAPGATWTIV